MTLVTVVTVVTVLTEGTVVRVVTEQLCTQKKLTYLPTYLCDSSYCSDDSDSSDSSDSSEGSDSSDQKTFFFPRKQIFFTKFFFYKTKFSHIFLTRTISQKKTFS